MKMSIMHLTFMYRVWQGLPALVFRTSDFEEAGMQCLCLRWVLRSEFTNHETQQVSIWYLYII